MPIRKFRLFRLDFQVSFTMSRYGLLLIWTGRHANGTGTTPEKESRAIRDVP